MKPHHELDAGRQFNTPTGIDTRGDDTFWELSLEKTVSENVAPGVALPDSGHEFGNVRNVAFIAGFAM